jgi:lantibiotic modifying enzyme
MSIRHFRNDFPDFTPNIKNYFDKQFIVRLIKEYVDEIIVNTNPSVQKIDRHTRADLYVGLAGIAFMFLKLSQSSVKDEFPSLQLAKDYSHAANEIIERNASKKYISLLSGNAGVHFTSAAINKANNESNDVDVKNLLRGLEIFKHPDYLDDGADEMLVGRCGFTLGILWLQKFTNTEIVSKDQMNNMAQIILSSGRKYAQRNECKVPLMYQYHGREYLGAAHGISAILFFLLSIPLNKNDLKDVKITIDALLDLQNEAGNFPSKFNKPDAELVHWCHGAPGMIYLMAKAYKIFNEQKYLDSCIKCGEIVWQKGLLKKGPGLCHGIASSGYVFLILFRLTNEEKYFYRAFVFAKFLKDEKFVNEARIPDRPFSLYEGTAGTVCFLLDLLHHETAEFPFMNVF